MTSKKKPIERTLEEREAIITRIDARVAKGEPKMAAIKAEGLRDPSQYYKWSKPATKKRVRNKRVKPTPQLLTLEAPSTQNSLMILWGMPHEVNKALQSIIQIQNG